MGAIVFTDQSVWRFCIDRPTRRNAMDSETAGQLSYMLREADVGGSCAAAVLYGQGAWFCAGSDLKELAGRDPETMAEIEAHKAELARTIQQIDIPVVAAVSGFALGGGVSLAAACDYVVSDADARWQMPEVLNGWLPPWGISPIVTRCGPVRARQVLWGREALGAEQALALGLVDRVAAPGAALDEALAIAAGLASLPRAARVSVKPYMRSAEAATLEVADRAATRFFVANCHSHEAKQTLSRFGVAN
jgi:enoyl-CoA hydratase/carnithine racemase